MNELTQKMQRILTPKAALIATGMTDAERTVRNIFWNSALSTKTDKWEPGCR